MALIFILITHIFSVCFCGSILYKVPILEKNNASVFPAFSFKHYYI